MPASHQLCCSLSTEYPVGHAEITLGLPCRKGLAKLPARTSCHHPSLDAQLQRSAEEICISPMRKKVVRSELYSAPNRLVGQLIENPLRVEGNVATNTESILQRLGRQSQALHGAKINLTAPKSYYPPGLWFHMASRHLKQLMFSVTSYRF